MDDFSERRERMVRQQIEARGVRNPAILEAFRAVPRELFVDEDQRAWAYDDHPLPIPAGQTISQPYIVALMIEAAAIGPSDLVLEVGAGSGYAAAVISRIARSVVAIERQRELVAVASNRLHRLGFHNVSIIEGDGTRGCPEHAPFDAVIAAASGSHVPQPLTDQLAPGGRIVMPVGNPHDLQRLVKVVLSENGRVEEFDLGAVRFVPLIGDKGWSEH